MATDILSTVGASKPVRDSIDTKVINDFTSKESIRVGTAKLAPGVYIYQVYQAGKPGAKSKFVKKAATMVCYSKCRGRPECLPRTTNEIWI